MKKVDFSQKSALIVDDQKTFSSLLKSTLLSIGFEQVVTSLNCDNAINLCEEQNFDLIICDLHFGQDCKNGLQLLEELHLKKYLAPHTVFIMASADAERSMVLGSIERSPDEYLVKPFSPAQLELRLHKQLAKKTELQAVYTAIYQQQPEAAITACKNILKTNHHHKNDCIKLLTKLYWQNDQYQNAKSLLEALPQSKNNHWLNISLAQTDYLLGNYQASIDRCERVLLKNKMQVDAHDIIAASYLKMKQQRKAFYAIENALYFSPYSLKRNLKACEIARENNELANIINYSRQIWEITKHSIHFDLAHLCNYVRSHLDAAEQVTDPNTKDRLQQQAFQSLKQMTEDTSVKSKWKTFDPEMYREIVNARVLFQNQLVQKSQNTFNQAQIKIHEKYGSCPLMLAPDSIKVMYDLGEFDNAESLLKHYIDHNNRLETNTLASLKTYRNQVQQPQQDYIQYNSQAISLFSKGQYQQALQCFKQAQNVAPANTAIALNLLKCKLQLIEMNNAPTNDDLEFCKNIYKKLMGMTLLKEHQPTFEYLKKQTQKHLAA